jgi:hypothetical protein
VPLCLVSLCEAGARPERRTWLQMLPTSWHFRLGLGDNVLLQAACIYGVVILLGLAAVVCSAALSPGSSKLKVDGQPPQPPTDFALPETVAPRR